MSTLARGVFAIARTKRRRFLWCVWWTGEPTEKPFRLPDAWGGGAHTEEEARALAEAAAKMPLTPIDGRWAGAFKRVRAGLRPFPTPAPRAPRASAEGEVGPRSPYDLLGVAPDATDEEVRVAFRLRALVHHPDQGGDVSTFIALKHAYDTVMQRRSRHRRRSGP